MDLSNLSAVDREHVQQGLALLAAMHQRKKKRATESAKRAIRRANEAGLAVSDVQHLAQRLAGTVQSTSD